MATVKFVYFGEKYSAATDGAWGYLVNDTTISRVEWDAVFAEIFNGNDVEVRQAEAGEIAWAESYLATRKLTTMAATSTTPIEEQRKE